LWGLFAFEMSGPGKWMASASFRLLFYDGL